VTPPGAAGPVGERRRGEEGTLFRARIPAPIIAGLAWNKGEAGARGRSRGGGCWNLPAFRLNGTPQPPSSGKTYAARARNDLINVLTLLEHSLFTAMHDRTA
jgi:hypothetical protein